MNYQSEREEVRTTVPTFVPYSTTTEGLPEGYMIAIDGAKFTPRHYLASEEPSFNDYQGKPVYVKGWMYFYGVGNKTITFASYEDAQAFIDGWVAFLESLNGVATPVATRVAEIDEELAQLPQRIDALREERDRLKYAPEHEMHDCDVLQLKSVREQIQKCMERQELLLAIRPKRYEFEITHVVASRHPLITSSSREVIDYREFDACTEEQAYHFACKSLAKSERCQLVGVSFIR